VCETKFHAHTKQQIRLNYSHINSPFFVFWIYYTQTVTNNLPISVHFRHFEQKTYCNVDFPDCKMTQNVSNLQRVHVYLRDVHILCHQDTSQARS
jgi:hypothetical protein